MRARHRNCARAILLDALGQGRDDNRARVVGRAKIQRQFVDVIAGRRMAYRRTVRFDHRLGRPHLDPLGRASDLELHVDTNDLPSQHVDFADVVLKPLQSHRQQIPAGVEVQNLERSARIGDRLTLGAGREIRCEHVCTWRDRRRRVDHRSCQRGQCRLRASVAPRAIRQARNDERDAQRQTRSCSRAWAFSFEIARHQTRALYVKARDAALSTQFRFAMTSCRRNKGPLYFATMQAHVRRISLAMLLIVAAVRAVTRRLLNRPQTTSS